MNNMKKEIVNIIKKEDGILVLFSDGEKEHYSLTWLAHHCSCSNCLDSTTNQKKITKISCQKKPIDLIFNNEEKTIIIIWNKEHKSYYTISNLMKKLTLRNNYNNNKNSPIKKITFSDYMDKNKCHLFLKILNDDGILILNHVPRIVNIIRSVAEQIAPIQQTIYGDVFNIRVDKNPINIAYTDQELPLHMDLPYYESPPGLQILHCLNFKSTVQGGLSTFLDIVKVANQFMLDFPNEFKTLTRIPACFQKIHANRKKPVNMVYYRPHFIINTHNELVAVNWSPPFEGPIKLHKDEVTDYFQAYKAFESAIDNAFSEYGYQFKLNTDEIVIFNNRRLLHGRTKINKIQKKADRWLQGCYINMDDFVNKFRTNIDSINNHKIYHFANQNYLEHS